MAKVKEGDAVTISGTVVAVEDDAITVEISSDDGTHSSRVTLNGAQATDAIKKA